MLRARTHAIVVSLVLLLGTVTPAVASDATGRIREFFGNVNRVLADHVYDDRLPERLATLRGMVVEMVDFGHAAQVALGPEWLVRTRSEREEFVRLFTDLLQTSVFALVGGRARLDKGLTVTYVGELDDRDGVTVATSVLTRSGAEMAVGYRMAQRNGRWMVRDVVVDGVSLVENYRAQFQKVIQRSSYAGLVSEMRTRIAELGHSPATAMSTPNAPVVVAAAQPTTTEPEPAVAPPPAPTVTAVTPPVVVPATAAEPAPVSTTPKNEPAVETARVAPMRVVTSVAPRTITSRTAPAATFWVQLGAYREIERAMHVVTALRDEAVSMISAPGQLLIRVLVGPFPNRAAATAKLNDLRRRGYEAFIAEATK